MLAVTQLKSRENPLAIEWVPVGGFDVDPLFPVVRDSVTALFARIDSIHPLPAVDPEIEPTPVGNFNGGPIPADTLRVYVGYTPPELPGTLGIGAPGSLPGERLWGGFVGFNSNLIRDGEYHGPTAAEHEALHVLGEDHSDNPDSIMYPFLPPRTERNLIPEDVSSLYENGYTLNGAVLLRFSYEWGGGGYMVTDGATASYAVHESFIRQTDAVSWPVFSTVEFQPKV